VPINYGFCLSFDFEAVEATGVNPVGGDCHIEDLDVEVWDNNMIVQLSMPKLGCQSYRVGCHPENLGDPLHLPRFEAVKESARYLLGKKVCNSEYTLNKQQVQSVLDHGKFYIRLGGLEN
jgi:hypothetical protein